MANKLELTWFDKEKLTSVEPRILIENKSLSHKSEKVVIFDEPSYDDNMLIHGDNLLGLKALLPRFANQVKCVYIDPPYNTGSAFEHYDDNLEHSIWLSLMRDRLLLIKELMADD